MGVVCRPETTLLRLPAYRAREPPLLWLCRRLRRRRLCSGRLGGGGAGLLLDLLIVLELVEDLVRAGDDRLALLEAGQDHRMRFIAGTDLHRRDDRLAVDVTVDDGRELLALLDFRPVAHLLRQA